MNGKHVSIDFHACDPARCDRGDGGCAAAEACRRRLLVQEERRESPMLLSATMCVACRDCVRSCPLGAVAVDRA